MHREHTEARPPSHVAERHSYFAVLAENQEAMLSGHVFVSSTAAKVYDSRCTPPLSVLFNIRLIPVSTLQNASFAPRSICKFRVDGNVLTPYSKVHRQRKIHHPVR